MSKTDVAGFYGCATIVSENLGSYLPVANGLKNQDS